MNSRIEDREGTRQFEQSLLDASTSKVKRNRLGQFATPPELANEIVENTWKYVLGEGEIAVLEPACGTGAFISAILRSMGSRKVSLQAFEIDAKIQRIASDLWQGENRNVSLADFTAITPKIDDKVDVLITNPPYSRHHHISSAHKDMLRAASKLITGIQPTGLAGLYCYFILLAHQWLKPGAVSAWLIPTEFMDVNYGKAIKDYLLQKVSLLRIHCFDSAESLFDDALVSSSVVWFSNQVSKPTGSCECTFGPSISEPKVLRKIRYTDLAATKKWTGVFHEKTPVKNGKKSVSLSDLFRVNRGIATGSNAYFIMDEAKIRKLKLTQDYLTPILPSSKYINENIVKADQYGLPILEKRLFLLNCNIGEDEIKKKYSSLYKYLQQGEQKGLPSKYLCSRRKPWYSQESRPPAPIVFTYMGRASSKKSPFRFIRNHSLATATNVYLMLYPTAIFKRLLDVDPQLIDYVWEVLNRISFSRLKYEGRSYGGGLHKVEPKELGNLLIHNETINRAFYVACTDAAVTRNPVSTQLPLFSS